MGRRCAGRSVRGAGSASSRRSAHTTANGADDEGRSDHVPRPRDLADGAVPDREREFHDRNERDRPDGEREPRGLRECVPELRDEGDPRHDREGPRRSKSRGARAGVPHDSRVRGCHGQGRGGESRREGGAGHRLPRSAGPGGGRAPVPVPWRGIPGPDADGHDDRHPGLRGHGREGPPLGGPGVSGPEGEGRPRTRGRRAAPSGRAGGGRSRD